MTLKLLLKINIDIFSDVIFSTFVLGGLREATQSEGGLVLAVRERPRVS